MVDVRFRIGDLDGGALGHYESGTLTVDADAAGHGWFVDLTPADSLEFAVRFDRSTLTATAGSEAFERMDLLTVVMHELGHAIGFTDGGTGYALMDEDLDPGVRYLLDELGLDELDPDQEIDDAVLASLAAKAADKAGNIPAFDFDLAQPQVGVRSGIDWQSDGWSTSYTPYAAPERPSSGGSSSSNFADYLVKLFKSSDGGYDEMGKSLNKKAKK